jgi:predicted site-specific integrase-resolvase
MRDTLIIGDRLLVPDRTIREMIQISQATQARWIKSGLLPQPIRLGKKIYFEKREVEQHLLNQGE